MPPLSPTAYFPPPSTFHTPSNSGSNSSKNQQNQQQQQPSTPPSTPLSGLPPSLSTSSDELILLQITRNKLELALNGTLTSTTSNSKTNLNQMSQIDFNSSNSDNNDLGVGGGGSLNYRDDKKRKSLTTTATTTSLRQLVLLQNCYCTLKEFWYSRSSNNDSSDYFNQTSLKDQSQSQENGQEDEQAQADEEEWGIEKYNPEIAWLEGILSEMQEDMDIDSSDSNHTQSQSQSKEEKEEIEDSGFLEASKYNISGSNSNRYFSSSMSSSSFLLEVGGGSPYSNLDDSLYSLAEAEEEDDEEIEIYDLPSRRSTLNLVIDPSPPSQSLLPLSSSTLLVSSPPIDLPSSIYQHQYNSELEYHQKDQFQEEDYEDEFQNSSPSLYPPPLTPDSSPSTSPSSSHLVQSYIDSESNLDPDLDIRRKRRNRRESIDEEFDLVLGEFFSTSISGRAGEKRSGLLDLTTTSAQFNEDSFKKDYKNISNLTSSLNFVSHSQSHSHPHSLNSFNHSFLSSQSIDFHSNHHNSNSNHYPTSNSEKFNAFHPLSISIPPPSDISRKDEEGKAEKIVRSFY